MEGEVSGIAKLGIVLIALAVLIGLGFGIFQISKSVANDGVGDVQSELDSIAASKFEGYDQKVVTGIMANSAVSDFSGESVAVLIATQTWNNSVYKYFAKTYASLLNSNKDVTKIPTTAGADIIVAGKVGTGNAVTVRSETDSPKRSVAFEYTTAGIELAYNANGNTVPIIFAFEAMDTVNGVCTVPRMTRTSVGRSVPQTFINYNAILGNIVPESNGILGNGDNDANKTGAKTATQSAIFSGYLSIADGNPTKVYMAYIYFDSDCYRCTSGFAVTDGGRVIFNNVTSNLTKSGRAEFIPNGAKFEAFLIKDDSGSNIGVTLSQITTN